LTADVNLEFQIKLHEGLRLEAYPDSLGFMTIGYGHLLPRGSKIKRIDLRQAEAFFVEDLAEAIESARLFPWFGKLSKNRQCVVIDMVFNLGIVKFRRFKATAAYISKEDFERAAGQMLHSRWARQVGGRAERLAYMMVCDIDFHRALSIVP
jgi:lysozyme